MNRQFRRSIHSFYLHFVAFQFVSQRHRPVRGSTSKLLLDYIRTFPCKVNLLINTIEFAAKK